MTDQAQKSLRSYSAYFLKAHGLYYPESDPLLPALYSIHLEVEQNSQTNREIASLIKEVSSKINPKQFNFYSGDAAEKFQKGITRRWMLFGILSLVLVWGAVLYLSMTNDLDRARIIIGSSSNADELLKRVKKDNEGFYYLDFSAASGKSVKSFNEFWILNPKTVRVYLGKEAK